MGFLDRFTSIVKANINELLDKAEDPEKMVDQYLREMTESLAEVREATAGVMAEEKRCKKLLDENREETEKYEELARKALAAGNEALRAEDVKIDKLYGHGGIFKTPKVAQSLLAAALEAPVTVMATAGEGGAWGQAVAAAYMKNREEGESLADYLTNKVFAGMEGTTLEPDAADVEGYRAFLAAFRKANEAEKAAAAAFAE